MSASNCGNVERYLGIKEPRCLGGKGCDACWSKFRNPPSYSLPWMKRSRKDEFAQMEALARAKREPLELKLAREKAFNLMKEAEATSAMIIKSCPHVIENQKYSEWTNEDTYGRRSGPMHSQIQCNGCGKVLARDGVAQ